MAFFEDVFSLQTAWKCVYYNSNLIRFANLFSIYRDALF